MFAYVGKTVDLVYELGYKYRVEYLTINKLRWTSLTEKNSDLPQTGEEEYYLHEIEPNLYGLSWIEDTGLTVSQILDFNHMKVFAFMSWNEPKARGGRASMQLQGIINLTN